MPNAFNDALSVSLKRYSGNRKPTHTDQYLQFTSHQPLEHKMGVIRTLTHRAKIICSTQEAKEREMQHLKEVLSISGYQKWTWDSPGSKMKQRSELNSPPPAKKGHVTMPYVGGISESLTRKIRKTGVAVHARPVNTIRSQLVAPKDSNKIREIRSDLQN
jgi:hypothetical protein